MDNRKKTKLLNVLTGVVIAVIAVCAVMTVGHARGWFGTDEGSAKSAADTDTAVLKEDASEGDSQALAVSDSDTEKAADKGTKKESSSGKKNAGNMKADSSEGSAASSGGSTSSGKSSSSSGGSTSSGKSSSSSGSSTSAGKKSASSKSSTSAGKSQSACTVTIVCTEILQHMDDLKKGKAPYVPSDGVILARTKVTFSSGETVYDVTRRVCTDCSIQIEAAYTPVYGSYYIEGIHQLYEFDCGEHSGWTYTVNGTSPNYGSSDYVLSSGDQIVWYYTCTNN